MNLALDRSFPSISVIIPIYNGEADLPDLLDCLQHQTYPVDRVEYLLVDNGSSDRTVAMLQSAESRGILPLQALSETQIQSSYAARNRGIRAASHPIFVFTDADCRPQPDWLSCLVQPFINPQIGIVAGEITALPGRSWLERYADRHETLSQKHTLAHTFCAYGQTANLAIRRSALEQVGLFRPYLTTGGDADLCWRILRQTSWQIQLAADAMVQHRHRSTLTELQSQWRRYGRSNRYLHQIHHVSLAKPITWQDWLYRLSRWLLKEVPQAVVKSNRIDAGEANPSRMDAGRMDSIMNAIVDTPLDLLCGQARAQGQRHASLPETAWEIAWLTPTCPEVSPELLGSVSESIKVTE
ncbi:MAG: glycosyltransferase [Leptolyngbyaceae cyanobacterium CRU_2_3]|nr:glycosyltransferase [Leptolyngbyaceae cyanobacterium CRU_2_3]